MPICITCKKQFSKSITVNGYQHDISKRKHCVECLPIKIRSNPKSNSEMVSSFRKRMIQKAIIYKGGKCKICGYNKCNDALDFHHRNPNEKEFGISNGNTYAWEKLKLEIDKCDLLCSNCHREIHSSP